MGRGKRQGPGGQILLSDGDRGSRVPASLQASLAAPVEESPEPLPASGEHTRSLRLTQEQVDGEGGGFIDACVGYALEHHSSEAFVVKIPAEGDGYLEVVVSDNDGDLVVTWCCELVSGS